MTISHPLIDAIRKLQESERSGALKVVGGREAVTFHIREGLVEAVASGDDDHLLGQLLVREKLVRPMTLKRLLTKAHRLERPLGETLLDAGAVRQSVLLRVLRHQSYLLFRRCLDSNFKVGQLERPVKTFRFPLRIPLDSLLLELARDCSRTVSEDRRWYAHLIRREDADFDFIDWWPAELSVLSVLRRESLTIGELGDAAGLDEEELRNVLAVLKMAGYVGVSFHRPTTFNQGMTVSKWIVPRVNELFRSDKLELVKDRNSFVSEQFKSLKINLNGTNGSGGNGNRPPQVIGISSPFMGDGKSLVSSNLAVSLSQDPGRKTILVDCDLRKPTMHDYLGIPAEPGVTHFLTESGLDPFCYLRRFNNLYVMTVGRVADNPIELLSLKRMASFVQRLREEFDTIILDCPPFEPISDTRILSTLADGLVLVVRSGKTPYACGERASKAVDREKLLGIVLNDVKPLLFNTYYSYGYYYYGEKGGYPYAPSGSAKQSKKS